MAELPQVSFLSRQNFCCDKHVFVFCCVKCMLVATNLILLTFFTTNTGRGGKGRKRKKKTKSDYGRTQWTVVKATLNDSN